MKHIKKRILNIINELTMYLFSSGATDISIHILERNDDYKISMQCNYNMNKKIDTLIEILKSHNQEEIEECYWELAGDSDDGSEVHLVAMMVNRVETWIENNLFKMDLYKNK